MSTGRISISIGQIQLPATQYQGISREEWASRAHEKARDVQKRLYASLQGLAYLIVIGNDIELVLSLDIRNMTVSVDYSRIESLSLRRTVKLHLERTFKAQAVTLNPEGFARAKSVFSKL